MLDNYLKLLLGTSIGGITTFINMNLTPFAPSLLAWLPVCFGAISAAFTCVYLYYQIKKIRKELKEKANG